MKKFFTLTPVIGFEIGVLLNVIRVLINHLMLFLNGNGSCNIYYFIYRIPKFIQSCIMFGAIGVVSIIILLLLKKILTKNY